MSLRPTNQIPARKEWRNTLSETGKFARNAVNEFVESDLSIAVVEDWPELDCAGWKATNKRRSALKGAIEVLKLDDVIGCCQRSNQVFIYRK